MQRIITKEIKARVKELLRTSKINENGFEYVDSGRTDKHQPIVKVGYREYYLDPHL